MTKIISICSGKGGVGKTTVALNVAAALHRLNKSVVVIDLNLTTSHLGLSLGMYSGKTVNSFLRNEIKLEDAVQIHSSGLKIVPASLELNDLTSLALESLKEKIKESFRNYDFVILDSAPGVGREALLALKSCDEVLFVATPHVPSVVDVFKVKDLASTAGFHNIGIILNRVRGKNYELSSHEVFRFTDLPVIATVPEDERILKCANTHLLALTAYPKTKTSKTFFYLAHKIAGIPFYDNKKPFL